MSTARIRSGLAALRREPLLALSLKLDAVVSGATGVVYLAFADPLSDLFELPVDFLRAIGAFLVVFSVGVWMAARRPRPWATAVIAANLPWILASIALVGFDLHDPNTFGALWTMLQAMVVALFVALQLLGLRGAREQVRHANASGCFAPCRRPSTRATSTPASPP